MIKDKQLEIILPIYNEESILKQNVLRVKEFLDNTELKYVLSIVDNGSKDNSYKIAKELERKHNSIITFRLKEKGRGRALRYRLLNSDYPVVGYMDIDLSTKLSNLLDLYRAIEKGFDIAIGSRLLPNSQVKRTILRTILSKFYCKITRRLLNVPIKDYQCGFKLFKRTSIISIIDNIKNNNWFFDTELIFYSYTKNIKIIEVPVCWIEDRNRKSKVNIAFTIFEDIKGILRLRNKS